MKDELPEWNWPFVDHYTGPYWSDGKFQTSVEKGERRPSSKLDRLSKRHDNQYYSCGSNLDCLDDADELYYQASRGMSIVPRVVGLMPKYGNQPGRQATRLGRKVLKMGLWEDLARIVMPWRDKKKFRGSDARKPVEEEKIIKEDRSPPTQEPFATVPVATNPQTQMMEVCYIGEETNAEAHNVRLYYPKFKKKWDRLPKPNGRTVE